jgi:hypothetical protein
MTKHTQDSHQDYLAHKAAVEQAAADYEELKRIQLKYEEAEQAVANSSRKFLDVNIAELDIAKKAYETFLRSHNHYH